MIEKIKEGVTYKALSGWRDSLMNVDKYHEHKNIQAIDIANYISVILEGMLKTEYEDTVFPSNFLQLKQMREDIRAFVEEINGLCQFYNDKKNVDDYTQAQRDTYNTISEKTVFENIKRHVDE